MEPFRAFVGDNLSEKQRTLGFAMQSFFIGVGAVVASSLPWMLENWFEVSNMAAAGQIPATVKLSFYAGGAVFLLAVCWTVLRSREYSPGELASFDEDRPVEHVTLNTSLRPTSRYRNGGIAWIVAGAVLHLLVYEIEWLDQQVYILSVGTILFGVLQLITGRMQSLGKTDNGMYSIMTDLFHMPRVMRQLAVVQFFSWFALFSMWIYATAAVTDHHYATSDVTSVAYNEGANWVGVLFSVYNGVAALAAIAIPFIANHLGCRPCHLVNLVLGGLGLISFYFISDPQMLVVSMIGVGIAWASILSLPYALLSNNLPANKMGVYMGIFNFFIVIPQLVAASILGLLLRELFAGRAILCLVAGGGFMIVAGVATMVVDKDAEPAR
jgi:maltose/moltooligosaccharide transporter